MDGLFLWQYISIALIFIWTGFVRSGLGFGGAALGLPLLLLVVDNALIFIPIIGLHLLFFSSITLGHKMSNVDWSFLKMAFAVMLVPKLIGVFGLLTLPTHWMTLFVYSITLFYGFCYLLKYQIRSQHVSVDYALLVIGAYVSGTSLIGAPLIVAVVIRRVSKEQLRNTLFVLWFVLVSIKLSVLVYADIPFWLWHQWWLLPCAAIGHVIGLKMHDQLMSGDAESFKQWIGAALIIICLLGLYKLY